MFQSGADIAFSNASGEVSLVFFTALAPASAIAFVIMVLALAFGGLEYQRAYRLGKTLGVPLVLCMVGLVASATHLGNPSNALYVVSRVGASPLSNEVASAAVFLVAAALSWMITFAERKHPVLRKALALVTAAAGVLFMSACGFAYNVSTIETWNTPTTPASIILGGFVVGPLLALGCFLHAEFCRKEDVLCRVLVGVSFSCAVGLMAVYAFVWGNLPYVGNELYQAAELVPRYGAMLAGTGALLTAAFAIVGAQVFTHCGAGASARTLSWRVFGACALAFGGLFVMRFAFYLSHLTVGMSL